MVLFQHQRGRGPDHQHQAGEAPRTACASGDQRPVASASGSSRQAAKPTGTATTGRPGRATAWASRSEPSTTSAPPVHARATAWVRRGLHHPLREWLDGVWHALCVLPAPALGLSPLRPCGNTPAPTPTGDVRHEVARVFIREIKDPVSCHRHPTEPCAGGTPGVRSARDTVASA